VDYGEAFGHLLDGLAQAVAEAPQPVVVLLTTRDHRTAEQLQHRLRDSGHCQTTRAWQLMALATRASRLFRLAVRGIQDRSGRDRAEVPEVDPGLIGADRTRWTSLDIIMLAWLTVTAGAGNHLPITQRELYRTVLEHEGHYWTRVYRERSRSDLAAETRSDDAKPDRPPDEDRLREAAALMAVFTPQATLQDVLLVLAGAADPNDPNRPRDDRLERVARTLIICLSDPSTGNAQPRPALAVRPDPIADHLISEHLSAWAANPKRVAATLERTTPAQRGAALLNVTRAASWEATTPTTILAALLEYELAGQCDGSEQPAGPVDRSVLALFVEVAALLAGPTADLLEQTLRTRPVPDWLLDHIVNRPAAGPAFRSAGLLAAQKLTERARTSHAHHPDDPDTQAQLARSLNSLAIRLSEVGRRDEALEAGIVAVELYRQLATADAAAHTPGLIMSLNNLAIWLAEIGRRDEALDAATEAVELYRPLVTENPASYAPGFANILETFASRLSQVGRLGEALDAALEALKLYPQPATADAVRYTPGLAELIHTLANLLWQVGRRDEALDAATRAVKLYRQLVAAAPAAYHPELAESLNTLANLLSEVGRRDEALQAATDAVELRRQLAAAIPAAHTPNLAESLDGLAGLL
jgi:tetratricopeptide (TPR) repeat protein